MKAEKEKKEQSANGSLASINEVTQQNQSGIFPASEHLHLKVHQNRKLVLMSALREAVISATPLLGYGLDSLNLQNLNFNKELLPEMSCIDLTPISLPSERPFPDLAAVQGEKLVDQSYVLPAFLFVLIFVSCAASYRLCSKTQANERGERRDAPNVPNAYVEDRWIGRDIYLLPGPFPENYW